MVYIKRWRVSRVVSLSVLAGLCCEVFVLCLFTRGLDHEATNRFADTWSWGHAGTESRNVFP